MGRAAQVTLRGVFFCRLRFDGLYFCSWDELDTAVKRIGLAGEGATGKELGHLAIAHSQVLLRLTGGH